MSTSGAKHFDKHLENPFKFKNHNKRISTVRVENKGRIPQSYLELSSQNVDPYIYNPHDTHCKAWVVLTPLEHKPFKSIIYSSFHPLPALWVRRNAATGARD